MKARRPMPSRRRNALFISCLSSGTSGHCPADSRCRVPETAAAAHALAPGPPPFAPLRGFALGPARPSALSGPRSAAIAGREADCRPVSLATHRSRPGFRRSVPTSVRGWCPDGRRPPPAPALRPATTDCRLPALAGAVDERLIGGRERGWAIVGLEGLIDCLNVIGDPLCLAQ